MNAEEAQRLAVERLDSIRPGAYAITRVQEFDVGWVFFYNSTLFVETGDWLHALGGNAPILVDRVDASVHFTGTALPGEEYIDRYRARDPEDDGSCHP